MKIVISNIISFNRWLVNRINGGLPLDWDASKNWGDKLNPFLIDLLVGKKAYKPLFEKESRYFMIGSILDRAKENSVVWGAGFIAAKSVPAGIPRKIYAVRGPKSREIYMRHGVDCPEVYGDPAILISQLLPRKKSNKYLFGIIPHYVDKSSNWVVDQKNKYGDQVKVINVEGGILDFINDVVSCEYVVSSSLHGLICADAYGIPNVRIELSSNVLGGKFKYDDYRLGVGGDCYYDINPDKCRYNLEDLIHLFSCSDITCTQKMLLNNCPFC